MRLSMRPITFLLFDSPLLKANGSAHGLPTACPRLPLVQRLPCITAPSRSVTAFLSEESRLPNARWSQWSVANHTCQSRAPSAHPAWLALALLVACCLFSTPGRPLCR
jgi:hypothetical protein